MTARDPAEEHRASTPLELLFDLCFVVAVSYAASGLHHGILEGRLFAPIAGFLSVFFAIWWAWMNFTWFASAYDTDDVPYRLLTLLTIAGVLTLAAGVPAAFADGNFLVVTIGYLVMRVALVAQWLRAAAGDRDRRPIVLRYVAGIVVLQAGWLLRLALPETGHWVTFVILVAGELAVPLWAERAGEATSWHPEHIAERYGLFTIIVLGECILAATVSLQSALTAGGISAELLVIAASALVIVFGLWWSYFQESADEALREEPSVAFLWGYSHYLVFVSIAALGAGLQVVVGAQDHAEEVAIGDVRVALSVAVPVALYLAVLVGYRCRLGRRSFAAQGHVAVAAVAVLAAALAAGAMGVPATMALIAAAVALLVTVDVVADHGVSTAPSVSARGPS